MSSVISFLHHVSPECLWWCGNCWWRRFSLGREQVAAWHLQDSFCFPWSTPWEGTMGRQDELSGPWMLRNFRYRGRQRVPCIHPDCSPDHEPVGEEKGNEIVGCERFGQPYAGRPGKCHGAPAAGASSRPTCSWREREAPESKINDKCPTLLSVTIRFTNRFSSCARDTRAFFSGFWLHACRTAHLKTKKTERLVGGGCCVFSFYSFISLLLLPVETLHTDLEEKGLLRAKKFSISLTLFPSVGSLGENSSKFWTGKK